jgi:peptide deformylase
MIYNLVDKFDPILKLKVPDFDFSNPPINPEQLFRDMKETMITNRGIGLSCNQCGLPYRMFVFGLYDDPDNIVGCFNPKITSVLGDDVVSLEEGCLSFPGTFVKVKRPESIRVRYTTYNGVTDTIKFNGLSARIFQHELDHLNGFTFRDRVSRLVWDKSQKK